MDTEHKFINKSDKETTRLYFTRQLFVCLTPWSFFYLCGLSSGCPTVAIPQLNMTNSTAVVTAEMASWIASIFGYTGACYVIIVVLVSHFFGRRKCLLLLSINSIGASTLLYCSYNPVHILICQALYGMIIAAQMTILMMMLTEYTSAKYRGIFLTIKSATFFWGVWSANAIGIFADFRYIGLLGILCSCYNFAATFFIPESPYWLAFKGRYEDCSKAHRWLKGDQENADKELNALITTHKETRKNKIQKSVCEYIANCFLSIREQSIYKPVLLNFLLYTFYQMSGKIVTTIYAIEIMKKITGNESTTHIGVLVLDGFSVVGMYVGCGLSRILNRRTLLLVSSTIATIFLFMMSLYLYLIELTIISENAYITVAILVGYSLAICCGPMIVATSICCELLPMKHRSFNAMLLAIFCSTVLGVMIKVSPYMFEAFDFHGTYLFFGIGSSICLILLYFYLPETKGKTLYEIAAIFEKEKTQTPAQISLLHNNLIK